MPHNTFVKVRDILTLIYDQNNSKQLTETPTADC